MRCLADFVLDSDLCLDPATGSLTLDGPGGSFALTLSNAKHDPLLPSSVLSAQIIFEAPSFENIRATALALLAECLNVLSYATNRKFSIVMLKRIVDWTPGTVDRQAIVYTETPEWDIAEPGLDHKFVDAAKRLLEMSSGQEQQEAMRWYRLAIQAPIIEEQFSYFWFALEITAENLKGTDRVTSKCPRCQGPLFCEKCGDHPVHRRYPGEAIQQIIQRVHSEGADEIFSTLQTIRHTLMHGGRISSVRSKLPCNEQEAVNKLAFVTWRAISLMFNKPDPTPAEELNFGYVENMVRRKIVGSAHMVTQIPGDPNNPRIEDFPTINFSINRANSVDSGLAQARAPE